MRNIFHHNKEHRSSNDHLSPPGMQDRQPLDQSFRSPRSSGTSASSSTKSASTKSVSESPNRSRRRSLDIASHVHNPLRSDPHSKLLHQLSNSPMGQPILDYYGTTVYREDLDNLKDDEWFNDNNITFQYELLEQKILKRFPRGDAIVLLRPAMAYLLLHSQGNPSDLESALPSMRKARFVFLPINDNPDVTQVGGGAHWSLLVVSILDRKALYYDTFASANYQATLDTTRKLAMYLGYPLDLVEVSTPQQNNLSDCGILVAEITRILLTRLVNAEEGEAVGLGLREEKISPKQGRRNLLKVTLDLILEYDEREKLQ